MNIKAINMSIVFADIVELTVRELVKKYKSILLEENVKQDLEYLWLLVII